MTNPLTTRPLPALHLAKNNQRASEDFNFDTAFIYLSRKYSSPRRIWLGGLFRLMRPITPHALRDNVQNHSTSAASYWRVLHNC